MSGLLDEERRCPSCGLLNPGPEHSAHEPMLCAEQWVAEVERLQRGVSGLPDEAEPRKAYYVERITRGVTTALVYAYSARDARERYIRGETVDVLGTEHEGRGFGRVRRAPEEDRDA